MKILHVSKFYFPYKGGLERNVQGICEELKLRGHGVEVLCSTEEERSIDYVNSIKVTRIPMKIPKKYSVTNVPMAIVKNLRVVAFEMAAFMKKSDADIIHIHLPNPWACLAALLSRKKNIFITYHSDIIEKPYTAPVEIFNEKLLRRAKAIFATSKKYAEHSEMLSKFSKKNFIAPNFVDEKKFVPKGIPHDGKRVLFVGRLISYKGLEYLIGAMKKISERIPNVKLIVIGGGMLEEKLKKQAEELDIGRFIEWRGELHENGTLHEYQSCDVFVLPSIYKSEAFGIVQLEAMSCEKPVISCDIEGSGVSWVNQNNETGFVVEPRDSDSLANAVIKILENKKLARKFGKAGRERVLKFFTRKKVVDGILKVYEKLV